MDGGLMATLVLAAALMVCLGAQGLADDAAPGHAAANHAAVKDDAADEPAAYRILERRADRVTAVLPNRMIVVAAARPGTAAVSAQVWVKTGSVYEQEHVGAGLSHFLEHLLAGGSTAARTEAQSNAVLGDIGARTNAATSLDTVRYYINTTRPYAAQAVELLSDWMRRSLITQTEYARERQVIQNEFAMGQGDPGRLFWRLTQQVRYAAHPARHPTIGYLDEFLAVGRDEIHDFYRRMYVPNNMVFVVSGDIDPAAVVRQAAELWSDAEPGELPALSFPIEPPLEQPREAAGRADIRAPRLRLAFAGTRLGAEGDYALDLLGTILGQGESSRLVRSLRDQRRLVNSVEAYNLSFAWGEGFFGIDAEAAVSAERDAQQAVDAVRQAVLEQLEQLRQDGVTQAELERAKRQTLAAVVLSAQTAEGLAARLAHGVINTGDVDYMNRYIEAVQRVTAEQVAEAARRFLRPQRLIAVTLLPADEAHPVTVLSRDGGQPDADGFEREPLDLDNAGLIARLEANLAQAAGERAAAVIEPPVVHTLPNGLRVVIGRSTQAPGAAVQLYQRGGLLADEPGREGLTNAMASMLTRGTRDRSADQIAAAIDALGASLSAGGGNNSFFVQAVCLSEDLPTILDLLAEVTLEPTFPDDEWDKRRQLLLAAIDRQTDQWSGELQRRFRETYYEGHVWSQLSEGRREAVAGFTADDLRQWHARTLDAGDAVLAIFGDVDSAAVWSQAQSLFAAMPARDDGAFTAPQPPAPTPRVAAFTTSKPLAAVQIGFGPGVTRDHPDYAVLRVLAKVISRFPSGRLEQALRGEGKGLAYAVGAWVTTGLAPGCFNVLWNSSAADLDESLTQAARVLARVRGQMADETDLQRAKAAVLTDEFFGKQTNADRAADAALNLLYGLELETSQRFFAEVRAVTPAQLRDAARRYLRNPVLVVIGNGPVDGVLLESVNAMLASDGE